MLLARQFVVAPSGANRAELSAPEGATTNAILRGIFLLAGHSFQCSKGFLLNDNYEEAQASS